MAQEAATMDGDKFDSLMTHIGTGRWNIMYFVASGFWFFIQVPMDLSGVYLAPPLNYTCLAPDNATLAEDSCSYVTMTEAGEELITPCTEWDFDDSVYTSTLTSEFQLVCGRAYLRATYQGSVMWGCLITQLVWGYLADRFGRKTLVLPTYSLIAVFGVAMSFMPSFSLVVACRVLIGALANSTMYQYAMEVCEVKQRSLVGIVLGLPWAFGTMAWGGLAYCIREWRILNLVASVPKLLILCVLFLDESPRWLVVARQEEKAKKVMQRAARMNKVELPPDEELTKLLRLEEDTRTGPKEQRKIKLQCGKPRLLSTFPMRCAAISLFVMYFLTDLVYSGLNLSGAALSADPFLYLVLLGLMEIPGYTIAAPIIGRWGRKVPLIAGYLVCGLSLLALAIVPSDISWLVMTLAMTGKLCVSAAFMVLVVYQAEIQPTEVRLQGKSLSRMAAVMGYFLAPYITDLLAGVVPWLPPVIFGVASLIVCVLLLPFPETLNMALPQTVADFEILWKRKWLSSKVSHDA